MNSLSCVHYFLLSLYLLLFLGETAHLSFSILSPSILLVYLLISLTTLQTNLCVYRVPASQKSTSCRRTNAVAPNNYPKLLLHTQAYPCLECGFWHHWIQHHSNQNRLLLSVKYAKVYHQLGAKITQRESRKLANNYLNSILSRRQSRNF